uniref:Secreted protein n=1 Tax=Globodera rostochiensis TaxID=31243 RepID=A0A914GY30_GLORO
MFLCGAVKLLVVDCRAVRLAGASRCHPQAKQRQQHQQRRDEVKARSSAPSAAAAGGARRRGWQEGS